MIDTIRNPSFINLQPMDISPLMSSCTIKVLYVGQNRNHSLITEEVAANMAKTLRGSPIVGCYNPNKEDFEGHGDIITIKDGKIDFSCATVPYGFVSPDAKVWFEDFDEPDGTTHKYLMTTGYLWTTQFKEAMQVILEGKGQSMELDKKTLSGDCEIVNGVEFFIINDATFSKLCILGDEVEPCFEGASIYTLDDNFKNTLFSMMKELKRSLEHTMKTEPEITTTPVPETAPAIDEPVADKNDDMSAKYNLLQENFSELKETYNNLKAQYEVLTAFKEKVEDEKKVEFINKFSLLSTEEKEDVMNNRGKLSLEDIENALSVKYARKKAEELKENPPAAPITTFSIMDNLEPAWVTAVKRKIYK